MLKLATNNPNPQQPSQSTRLAAIVARAIMTESAPASFFGEGVPDEWPPLECQKCKQTIDESDHNASEFLGWHGACVSCFMKEDKL